MNDKAKELTTMPLPDNLLSIAVEKGADLAQIEKLMDLKDRYEKAEAKKAYIVAMANFRANCPEIDRTRQGHNSKYSGLAETITKIKDAMSDNGLSHSWNIEQTENGLISVGCCITHINGHSENTSMLASPDDTGSKNSIQAIGSTVSYLERYTLFALLGLASKETDNDGGKPVEYITEKQLADLNCLLEEVGADKEAFLKVCKVDDLTKLPADKLDNAVKRLEMKR